MGLLGYVVFLPNTFKLKKGDNSIWEKILSKIFGIAMKCVISEQKCLKIKNYLSVVLAGMKKVMGKHLKE